MPLSHGRCHMGKPKERVVSFYENFFQGKDFEENFANFGDEIFLIRANTRAFEECGKATNDANSSKLVDNLLKIFDYCLAALDQDNQIKIINSLLTLSALFKTFDPSSGYKSIDISAVLLNSTYSPNNFQLLILHLETLLQHNCIHQIKELSLKLILLTLSLIQDVNKNPLAEIYISQNLFESLFRILTSSETQIYCSEYVILILVILYNYRKHEKPNPYIIKLSIIDELSSLNVYGSAIATTLSLYNKEYYGDLKTINDKSGNNSSLLQGILSSLHIVSNTKENTFNSGSNEETLANIHRYNLRSNLAALLAFYEGVHSNRSFITTLTHVHVIKPKLLGDRNSLNRDIAKNGLGKMQDFNSIDEKAHEEPDEFENGQNVDDYDIHPCNLLTIFLEYTSITFLNIKDPVMKDQSKLCFLILTCLSEDPYANSVLHDLNLSFVVNIHKQTLRHRRVSIKGLGQGTKPLICSLLDLLSEFLMCHLMKNFPGELYQLCLGIIHRVLCYQKKTKTRVTYSWAQLWSALISTLKFLVSNELHHVKESFVSNTPINASFFALASQIITIFNLFITFGDNFLPSPQVYDELYYELVRMHEVFDNLQCTLARLATSPCNDQKEAALKLSNSLVNIAAIIIHFRSKIKYISDKSNIQSFTRENVLDIVRSNYDSLTLKLHQNLDVYVKYSEKSEKVFLENMTNHIVREIREEFSAPFEVDYLQILKELSS